MMRNRPKPRPPANPTILPAPVGGWNVRDSLAVMDKLDAPLLENLYPNATDVELRGGEIDWVTGIGTTVKTLIPFTGTTEAKLFACTDSGIYDVTNQGNSGAAETVLVDGYCSSTNLSTIAGNYLVVVNGSDSLKLFDGSTWEDITDVSTPSITGIATTEFNFVTLFKRRLWFVEKDSMSLWYLPVGQIGGAATEFDVGPLFKRGGYVIAATGWTIDGGEGLDDYFVIVSSEGELGVYKGSDPASANTWALVGLYYIGAPVNNRCLISYGGDLLYLCRIGLYPLSKVLANAVTLEELSILGKIQPAFNKAMVNFSDRPGWGMTIFPERGALIVNVPQQFGNLHYQFVQNLVTGAWTKFTGWDGQCFAVLDGSLYLGRQGKVTKVWVGYVDLNDRQIEGTAIQAFNNLRAPGIKKIVTLLKPFLEINGNCSIAAEYAVDYRLSVNYSFRDTGTGVAGVWGEGEWGSALWGATSFRYEEWFTPFQREGIAIGVALKIKSSLSLFKWNATQVVFQAGSVL